MEDKNLEDLKSQEETAEEEKKGYTPRPLWQIIGAWVALIVFIIVMVFFYINMLRGGM